MKQQAEEGGEAMVRTEGYVHTLAGRIRVKSPALKRAPQRAAEVERQLQQCDGITEVTTNPVTGSILVQYDPQRLSQEYVLKLLHTVGCLAEQQQSRHQTTEIFAATAEFSRGLIRTVAVSTMEFAVQRLVYAIL
jgi:copper chaperone CopZ